MHKQTIIHIVGIEEEGMRLDKFIAQVQPDLSRSFLQDLIRDGQIIVDSEPKKNSYRVHVDEEVSLHLEEPKDYEIIPENLSLDIVYEDDDLAVVYKPSGMVVHPAPGSKTGTLVHGLMYQLKSLSSIGGINRPGIVHRIDKDTSGLLMVAKNDVSHQSLSQQLKDKSVKREYIALVHGIIEPNTATIDAPLGRDPRDRKKMAVHSSGKEAVTHIEVIERFTQYTLISCRLETGRTHQIRVHMKYINHPLVGDPLYGPKRTVEGSGQFLHAQTLGFIHPKTNHYMEFTFPLPTEFELLLEALRKTEPYLK